MPAGICRQHLDECFICKLARMPSHQDIIAEKVAGPMQTLTPGAEGDAQAIDLGLEAAVFLV